MDRAQIEEKVREIISTQLTIKEDKLINSDDLIQGLGADSLDIIELILAIESEFALNIPDEDWDDQKIKTVQDVINYVVNKK